jgi:hypothetical protein
MFTSAPSHVDAQHHNVCVQAISLQKVQGMLLGQGSPRSLDPQETVMRK